MHAGDAQRRIHVQAIELLGRFLPRVERTDGSLVTGLAFHVLFYTLMVLIYNIWTRVGESNPSIFIHLGRRSDPEPFR